MKKLTTLLITFVLVLTSITTVYAGGDKVHGENATGPANRHGMTIE